MNSSDDKHDEDPLGPEDWVRDCIARETGCSIEIAAKYAVRIRENLDPSLREPLANWWRTATVDMNLSVEGWSLQRIFDKRITKSVYEAFTWLNGLITDRENALLLIERPRTVIIPHGGSPEDFPWPKDPK